jgi:hypothetical protein
MYPIPGVLRHTPRARWWRLPRTRDVRRRFGVLLPRARDERDPYPRNTPKNDTPLRHRVTFEACRLLSLVECCSCRVPGVRVLGVRDRVSVEVDSSGSPVRMRLECGSTFRMTCNRRVMVVRSSHRVR